MTGEKMSTLRVRAVAAEALARPPCLHARHVEEARRLAEAQLRARDVGERRLGPSPDALRRARRHAQLGGPGARRRARYKFL